MPCDVPRKADTGVLGRFHRSSVKLLFAVRGLLAIQVATLFAAALLAWETDRLVDSFSDTRATSGEDARTLAPLRTPTRPVAEALAVNARLLEENRVALGENLVALKKINAALWENNAALKENNAALKANSRKLDELLRLFRAKQGN